MPTVAAMQYSAFDEHQVWLKQLHEQHARHMAKAAATQHSPLPSAPMMWGRPDEANDVTSAFGGGGFMGEDGFGGGFAGIALADDEFEAPVYRSLGGFLGSDASDLDFAVEEESPRYRSMPGVSREEAPPLSAEDADAAWLASMPPLIRRQNALRQSIFDIP